MAIPKNVRDQLLVEARHRCTICTDKCFEIHHIIEQANGGTDDIDNLIVLCPNCHQHRYHRSGEFTPDQLRLYKQRLKDKNEVEKRVLQNLEEIRQMLPTVPLEDVENKLKIELQEAATLVSPEKSPSIHATVQKTSEWLADRDLIRGGARRAIEIYWEVRKAQEKLKYPEIKIQGVDENSLRKAPDFQHAIYFDFVLDKMPHPTWSKVFMVECKNSRNIKRKTYIERDRIVMVVADSDDLRSHKSEAMRLVDQTNKHIRTHRFQEIDTWCDREKRAALQQFDAIQSMKARIKGIKF
ncbi:MAG: hypothetical protein QG657_3774 [Acidobacteriota bacterium]|nr:hypothetical protein [Acidobacteriota bacterium]